MNMNNKDITLLTTWWDEVIELDVNIEHYLHLKSQAKQNWEDWIYIDKYKRFIKFSNLKDEKWKTLYISLPAPEVKLIELTPEEREKRNRMISKIMDKTYEWRKKTFVEDRFEILKRLAEREKNFWLQTTKDKLLELEWFKKKEMQKAYLDNK